jgi:NADPH:quinone reductase
MRAIQVHTPGQSDQLTYEEVPVPEPKEGEVRVKIAAIGLNFADVYQRKALNQMPLPFIPGTELAGVIDALGEGVSGLKVGERVVTASAKGAYAEYALVPAALLAAIPKEISFEQAAGVLEQGMTAQYLTHSTYPLKAGETALIHAAAGGMGQMLVQVSKMLGARVIGTASTPEKAALAKQLGADEVILYSQVDFETEVMRLTSGKGVEVVYDGVGKTTFLKGLNVLKPRGYMVLYGMASGPADPIDPRILNQKGSLYLTRPTLRHYLLSHEEMEMRASAVFGWMKTGKLKVRIDRTFPLAQAAAAQDYIENRETKGKVLLAP